MIPWNWMWAPEIRFPLSGNVKQDIEPDVDWFFDSIKPGAGSGRVEKEVFEVASYGRQLGLIMDVLVSSVTEASLHDDRARRAHHELVKLHEKIDAVKKQSRDKIREGAVESLLRLDARDPGMLDTVLDDVARRRSKEEKGPRVLTRRGS